MAKTLERRSIEELKMDMQEEGFRPETIVIAEEQARNIEPGRDHLQLERVIYITIMPDDSASIGGVNPLKRDNTQDVIDRHNDLIEALKQSQEARFILFKTQYLNSNTPLNNWVPLEKAVLMTRDNFKPTGETPLYDKTLSLLTSVMYEKNEASKRGHNPVRWGILLLTDGDDTTSKNSVDKVKIFLDDMRRTGELLENCEPDNTVSGSIALVGLEDRETDPQAGAHFEQMAHAMGIHWVLHADKMSETEMRRAFNTFSKRVAG